MNSNNKRKLSICESNNNNDILSNPDNPTYYNIQACDICKGEGKIKARRRSKKASFAYKREVKAAEAANLPKPSPPPLPLETCTNCQGTGLVMNDKDNLNMFPTVAIIGGGIGGLALALSLQHRHINAIVYERDMTVDERRQGYGLTMQQGAKALKALGFHLDPDNHKFGIHSKRHFVFDSNGTQVAQWGMKIWGRPKTKQKHASRQNAHIPRQELRKMLLNRLKPGTVQWGYKLLNYKEFMPSYDSSFQSNHGHDHIQMTFAHTQFDENNQMTTTTKQYNASILIGSDGIRSIVRKIKIGDLITPLNYLGCIVILGIVDSPISELTNGETVFQTADGTTRLYAMPFSSSTSKEINLNQTSIGKHSKNKSMWQLSFPMTEKDAKILSSQGPTALKKEALNRCGTWHDPIPLLLQSTPENLISGYPVYDRDVLTPEQMRKPPDETNNYVNSTSIFNKTAYESRVTLIGDAAHPMSPFKGQGANQALLDAVLLARSIYKGFLNQTQNKTDLSTSINEDKNFHCIVPNELANFEKTMLQQSSKKVKASAQAADFLHSSVVLKKGNVTRGAASKLEEEERETL